MTNDFLNSMARTDSLLDHDPNDACGQCHHIFIMAEVAREMIANNVTENVIDQWSHEIKRRWEESKFFKLWQEEEKAGRDPHIAFGERGWEP